MNLPNPSGNVMPLQGTVITVHRTVARGGRPAES